MYAKFGVDRFRRGEGSILGLFHCLASSPLQHSPPHYRATVCFSASRCKQMQLQEYGGADVDDDTLMPKICRTCWCVCFDVTALRGFFTQTFMKLNLWLFLIERVCLCLMSLHYYVALLHSFTYFLCCSTHNLPSLTIFKCIILALDHHYLHIFFSRIFTHSDRTNLLKNRSVKSVTYVRLFNRTRVIRSWTSPSMLQSRYVSTSPFRGQLDDKKSWHWPWPWPRRPLALALAFASSQL